MKKKLILAALAIGLSGAAQAQNQLIAQWDFLGDTGNQVTETAVNTVSNVTASVITRGGGLSASAAANSFSSSGWESTGGSDEYVSFGFTVASGYAVDLSSLLLSTRSSNTGPGTLGLFYGGDNFVSQLYTFAQSGTTTLGSSVNLSALPSLTGNVEFRIYEIGNLQADGVGETASTGTFRLANTLDLVGAVTAVPEPSNYAMLLAGLAVMGGIARRRKG